jgi:prepilin-type N-terminal cleavage/methylation domain-containing protein
MISKTGNKGFTLIEVMLTVAVLSIGIGGVLRAFIVNLDVMQASQEYITGISLAKDKMAELLLTEKENQGLAIASSEGKFQTPYADYAWKTQITPSDKKDLNVLSVTVFDSGIDHPKETNLINYVHNKT